jgi:hypothetical protein
VPTPLQTSSLACAGCCSAAFAPGAHAALAAAREGALPAAPTVDAVHDEVIVAVPVALVAARALAVEAELVAARHVATLPRSVVARVKRGEIVESGEAHGLKARLIALKLRLPRERV